MASDPLPGASSESDYLARAHAVLGSVELQIDAWLQDDVIDIDAQRTGGLLELSLPGGSKVILNTQPPLQELWIAARSGGYHFRFDGAQWLDTRSRREFFDVLSTCVSEQAGKALRFNG